MINSKEMNKAVFLYNVGTEKYKGKCRSDMFNYKTYFLHTAKILAPTVVCTVHNVLGDTNCMSHYLFN